MRMVGADVKKSSMYGMIDLTFEWYETPPHGRQKVGYNKQASTINAKHNCKPSAKQPHNKTKPSRDEMSRDEMR
jgi:hypothetical protein